MIKVNFFLQMDADSKIIGSQINGMLFSML